jgi:hypothetical protein
MELVDVNEIKATKKVKQLILDLQIKLLSTEDALEDMSRAAEIAEISGQFEMMSTFVRQANEVLAERIIRPDTSVKAGDYKMTVITDDEEDKKDAT